MYKSLTLLLVAIFIFSPLGVHAEAKLSDTALRESVKGGALWLAASQEKNGHFRYEYLPYEGVYRDDDNIVRQTGALFELSEIERLDRGNTYNFKKELVRSIGYFETLSAPGSYAGQEFRCIKEGKDFSCKLGATALAAIGVINTLTEYPDLKKKYEPLLLDYMAYIMTMKKDDVGFRYYYYPSRKKQKDDESSFSNGEAFLALVRYDQYAPSTEVKTMVDTTFSYLNNDTLFDAPLYLWVMAAIKDLERTRPQPAYVSYVDRYTAWRLLDNKRYAASTRNRCPYIEGLASAYSVLENHETQVLKPLVLGTIDSMIAQVSWLQIGSNNLYRYVIDRMGGRFLKLAEPKKAMGGFLTGSDAVDLTQRIDFTQHCLSAYSQALVDIRGGSL